MSHSINTKGISKTREELIKEHIDQSPPASTLPSVFMYFNPLKYTGVLIGDLDIYTPSDSAVLYAKSLTLPNIQSNTTSTIIEDSEGNACRLLLNIPYNIVQNTMLVILEPMLILKNGTSTIEIVNEKTIALFNDEQEFRNAGWGQKMPPGFSKDYYLTQAETLLEKKQYKEALRKYSIGMNHDPTNVEILSGLISCYMSLGDLDNALAISKRALEINPNHINIIKMRTKCLVDSNRIQEAKSLIENTRDNDISIDTFIDDKSSKKCIKCNRTRLSRLKELVLVEWPKLVSIEKIKKKLWDEGVHADRVSIRGKTAILIYDSVEKREEARRQLLGLEDSEFMLANEPAVYT
jgi:tetratricopeptide (TPR) repeat protein